MKRFALITCLAACLVFAFGASAFAQQDLVNVEDGAVGVGGNLTVGVFVDNSVSLNGLTMPLVFKAGTNGAYPTSVTVAFNGASRSASSLTGVRLIQHRPNPDGTCAPFGFFTDLASDASSLTVSGALSAPEDLINIVMNSVFPATPLAAGSDGAEPTLTIAMNVGGTVGDYVIDTACADPATHLQMVPTAGAAIVPTFDDGFIEVLANQCPVNVAAASDPVGATVGSQASNTITSEDLDDPQANTNYFLVSGPGAVDAVSGVWTWTPTCADVGSQVVEVEASDKGEGGCPLSHVSFTVNVTPTALQIGCSNVSVLWSGADAAQTINVSGGCPPYSYSADVGSIDAGGNWSYNQDCADLGTTPVTIDVMDDAGQQISCQFNMNVTNTAPVCSNPADLTAPTGVPFAIVLGPATDGDGEAITYSFTGAAPGWLSIVGNEIQGTRPGGDDAMYNVCYSGSDGCEASSECCVNILFESPFVVCFDDGDALNGVNPYVTTLGGRNVQICVWVDPSTGSSAGVGGFDFLICYDQSGLVFQNAYRGPDLDPTWEYFTWRTGMFGGNCGGACPDGFVRLVGITDMNNGITPDPGAFSLTGSVACLEFYVTDDQNFVGSCLHVGFCSYDCGDNVISSKDGNKLFLANSGATLGPDYDLEFCIDDTKDAEAEPFIDFCQGAICIIPPPDDRGDLNLNGIANEIGDAVLFSQFFIYGPSVWDPNPANMEVQVFASDVNNDGIELTVADLIYLIRIITGDAQPFDNENVNPKVAPYANSVNVLTDNKGGAMTMTTDATVELGGAVLVYRYSDVTLGEPTTIDGMTVKARAHNGELRVLIAPDVATGGKIPAGTNDLLTIPVEGNGSIELVESQIADANGALLEVEAAAKLVPTSYALHQNFPNPFNAGTVIPVTLKDASDYTLTIYNVAGQVVKTFQGEAEAGTINIRWDGHTSSGSEVASGMYFYRVDTPNFTDTRKMVVLK